jgi:hypothetical protein
MKFDLWEDHRHTGALRLFLAPQRFRRVVTGPTVGYLPFGHRYAAWLNVVAVYKIGNGPTSMMRAGCECCAVPDTRGVEVNE